MDADMSLGKLWRWAVILLAAAYFLVPLAGMLEFSLRAQRGFYSLTAYNNVLADPQFLSTFTYSIVLALVTVLVGIFIVLPTAFWVRLKLPQARNVIEFLTLLPLVIPTIVIAFGYIRLFNTSSWLPLTGSARGTDILLACGYVVLSLPYLYRAIDSGLRSIDIKTLAEAAQILGAGWTRILLGIILPNVFPSVLSGAFLTFAIVTGEYVIASLLDRPAFAVYMIWIGGNKAYEPAALAVIAFALTWFCVGLLDVVARKLQPGLRR
jgi:putative spermidine/putrescine transport system permease protein